MDAIYKLLDPTTQYKFEAKVRSYHRGNKRHVLKQNRLYNNWRRIDLIYKRNKND
jgi:hypothetical protein